MCFALSLTLVVRKVLQHSAEVENTDLEETEAKLKLCEKLGDLCCHLKAYSEAIRFYKQQVCSSTDIRMYT